MKYESKVVELRKMVFWWGLGFDSQKIYNTMIADYNSKGYRLINVVNQIPAFSLINIIKVVALTVFTLGFCSVYVGALYIFEKELKSE